MGVVLALGAALGYGLSDFLGGLLSRRISPWTVALLAQLVGAVPAGLTTADLVWGAASGIGSGLGTVFLYTGARQRADDGLLAGAGFGLLFVAPGQVPESAGLWPLAIGQSVALVVVAIGARIVSAPIRSAGHQLAARAQLVSVAAVLTSLYPALTVALAAVFLHERMNRTQACGLALAAAAVVLVALP